MGNIDTNREGAAKKNLPGDGFLRKEAVTDSEKNCRPRSRREYFLVDTLLPVVYYSYKMTYIIYYYSNSVDSLP